MSDSCTDVCVNNETLDEKLSCLHHELELALKWKRPSLLFAVYESDDVRSLAQNELETIVRQAGQTVVRYQVEYGQSLDLPRFLEVLAKKKNDVFYIYPGKNNGSGGRIDNLIMMLNSCRGFLADHHIRAVFWLTEKEALSVAHVAPDFWASRHRVIEFFNDLLDITADSNTQTGIKTSNTNHGLIKDASSFDPVELQMESPMVIDFSEKDEPSFSGINLLLMLGVENWKDGDLEKAIEPLTAALAIAEKSGNTAHQVMCHKAIALVKTDHGKTNEAIGAYLKVVELEKGSVTIWNNLGALYLKSGKFDEAARAFKSAIRIDPNDQVSWAGLGNVNAGNGQLDEAINCYRKALQFNPRYSAPWVQLGKVLAQQGRFDDALYAFMRIVEMDQKNVHAWSEIGNIYLKAGSFEQSIDAYKKAVMLGDQSPEIHKNLAIAHTHAGYFSEAIPHFQIAINAESDATEKAVLCNLLGDVFRRVGDYDNAVTSYELADKSSLTLEELSVGHSESFSGIEQNQFISSEENAESSTLVRDHLEQTNPIAQNSISEIQPIEQKKPKPSLENNPDDGTILMNQGLTATSPSGNQNVQTVDLLMRLADMYEKAGSMEKAIEAYLKVTSLTPDEARPFIALGQLYSHKGDPAEAIVSFKKGLNVLSSNKEKAHTLNLIGDEYRQLQDYSAALDSYWSAFGIDPDNESVMANLEKVQADLDVVIGVQNSGKKTNVATENSTANANPAQAEVSPAQHATAGNPPMETNQKNSPSSKNDLQNPEIWNELGNIYVKSNSLNEAAGAYEKALEINPEFGWSYSNLASVRARQGRLDEAIELLKNSLDHMSDEKDMALVWNRMGDLFRQAGQYSQAVIAYQKADDLSHSGSAETGFPIINTDQLFSHIVS